MEPDACIGETAIGETAIGETAIAASINLQSHAMYGQCEHIRGHPAECPYDELAVGSVICHGRSLHE